MSARTPDDGRGGAPAPGESRGEPCAPRWARARDALLARLPSWWWPVTDPHVRLAAGTECVGALAVVGDRLAVLDVEGAVGLRSLLDDAPGIVLDCPPMTAVTGLRRRTAERPDRLVTAGADGAVRIWDERGGRVGDFRVAPGPIAALAAVPAPGGGQWLAAAGDDGAVRVHDPEDGRRTCAFRAGCAVNDLVGYLTRSGRLRIAVSGSVSSGPAVSSSAGSDLVVSGPAGPGPANSNPMVSGPASPDSASLGPIDPLREAAGGVRVWDPVTGEPVGPELTDAVDECTVLAVWEDADAGPRLVTGEGYAGFIHSMSDEVVRMWDPATGRRVGEPLVADEGCSGYAPGYAPALGTWRAPDGTPRLAAVLTEGGPRNLVVWDPATGRRLPRRFRDPNRLQPQAEALAVWHRDDGAVRLVTAVGDSILVWDPELPGPFPPDPPVPVAAVVCTAADGGRGLAVTDRDDRLWLLDAAGEVRARVDTEQSSPHTILTWPRRDGPRIATVAGDCTVHVWDGDGRWLSYVDFRGPSAGVELVGAGEGTLIATTVAGVRRLWDPETGEPLGRGAIRPGGT